MADIIQTVELPDGTLQDVEVPEEWSPEQIMESVRGTDFWRNEFGEAPEDPGVARKVGFGLLKQSGLVEEITNLAEQKLGAREPTTRMADVSVSDVPTPPGVPQETRREEVTTQTGATEEEIRARQDRDRAAALKGVFPDIAGTRFEDDTAVKVGQGARLVTDLLTFPLPVAQQAKLGKMVADGTKVLGSSAGRRQLGKSMLEGGATIGVFGASDQAIRNLSDSGELDAEDVAMAGLLAGAGGAVVGPLLATGGGKFAKWLKSRVDGGETTKPIHVLRAAREAGAETKGLTSENAKELISAMEKVQANVKVEAEQLNKALGVTAAPTKKARAERQKELRQAFNDDAEMADFLAREADTMVSARAGNQAQLDQLPVEVRNMIRNTQEVSSAERRAAIAAQEGAQARAELEITQRSPEATEANSVSERQRAEGTAPITQGQNVPRNKSGQRRRGWGALNDVISRVENISPSLAIGLRRVSQRTASRSSQDVAQIDRFFKSDGWQKLSKKDQAEWSKAVFEGDLSKAHGIMSKTGINELYNENVFKLLKDVHAERRAAGADGFVEAFFPRVVRSVRKLRKRMGREERSKLDNALAKAALDKKRPLNEFETANVINQVVAGRPVKADRTRRVKEIALKDLDLYEDPRNALIGYLHRHREDVATREFFNQRLGRNINLGQSVDESSIGQLLASARLRDNMSDQDVSEMAELLAAHFGPGRQGPKSGLRIFKDIFTGSTLGFNPLSTLVQIGDIAPTLNRMGVRDTVRSLVGRNRVNVYDVGVREAAKELSTARGAAKFVRTGLKSMGFDALDKFAGNTAVNASLRKWMRKAKTNPDKLVDELEPLFPNDAARLVDDLEANRLSDDVKTLLLWDVGKIRPVSREDMPLHFNRNPNGRVFYSLLSWSLKQLNFLRNNAVADIAKGKVFKGTKGLVTLSLLMGMANMPADVIKDIVAGREVDPVQSGVEGMFQLGMTAKFMSDALNRGQGVEAIASAVPVMGITGGAASGLWQGIRDGDLVKLAESTPTGRALVNLLGDGTAADLASGVGSVIIPEAGANIQTNEDRKLPPRNGKDVPKDVIKFFENPQRVGRDNGTGLWLPHESIEGGTDTLGYGHKLTPAENRSGKLRIGDERVNWREGLNDAQINELLAQDTASAREAVQSLVRIPLNPNEMEALVSLVYNVGEGAFKKSKALRALNRHDRAGFMKEAFDPKVGFVKVNGKPNAGLINRRQAEAKLFATPSDWLVTARRQLAGAMAREEATQAGLARLLQAETGGFQSQASSPPPSQRSQPTERQADHLIDGLPPEMALF